MNKSEKSSLVDTDFNVVFEYLKKIENIYLHENNYSDKLIEFENRLKLIFDSCSSYIEKDIILFRSRVYKESDLYIKLNDKAVKKFNAYDEKNSFVNPSFPPNRMNPKGIPCLYSSSDIFTSILEINSSNNDYISVAQIKCNTKLHIADLSRLSSINDSRFDSLLSTLIQNRISQDDYEYGYSFSQYISMICKKMGYDGIAYLSKYANISSPREKKIGINYAIYNYSKCRAISSDFYQVNNRSANVHSIRSNDFVYYHY